MSNVAVIGTQWGDEGKGKIVDWLSENVDIVVRFQGGHNAGHTLRIEGTEYKLSLLPSGIVRRGKMSAIGNGVVVDPVALLEEMRVLRSQGVEISPENLMISLSSPMILSVHQRVDQAREVLRGSSKIGTTGRGIGPAYEDKVARRGVRMGDLFDMSALSVQVELLLAHHNVWLGALGAGEVSPREILGPLSEMRDELLPYLGEVWSLLADYERGGRRILFEGAQGVMLDIDHGTYPYVTSSNTVGGVASSGSGIGLGSIGYVLGITKAYTTRVGSGPFPTEDFGVYGESMGSRGREFGTVTGRRRRCGWFDAVMVRQAGILGGIDGIALTKLDVLDGFDVLRICVGYLLDGEEVSVFPASSGEQFRVEPIYEELDGWVGSVSGVRDWGDLPEGAVRYIRRLEELTGLSICSVSTGAERDDTILVKSPFGD